MDTKSAIHTHRGRELGTFGYPLAIQSLVHVTGPIAVSLDRLQTFPWLQWTLALRTLSLVMTC